MKHPLKINRDPDQQPMKKHSQHDDDKKTRQTSFIKSTLQKTGKNSVADYDITITRVRVCRRPCVRQMRLISVCMRVGGIIACLRVCA
ncbi:MAG: hypothetical protein GY820_15720 [Gammaproteobacteria bacterium]|nr:hypothetical protein [Gammaproteobacteria bacterium]